MASRNQGDVREAREVRDELPGCFFALIASFAIVAMNSADGIV
jgi:hypothetical protein